MSNCGSEAYGSAVVRKAHNWVCLVRAADEARNGHTGAAVDGPGSLLNYQGHPLDRLTPDRDVTNPSTDAKENGSHHNPGRNALPPSPSALSAGVYVDDLLSDDPDRCAGVLVFCHCCTISFKARTESTENWFMGPQRPGPSPMPRPSLPR